MSPVNDEPVDDEPVGRVTIFGAGITGLTVAHELIVRGFEVSVVERAASDESASDCKVGGMAATQYAHALSGPVKQGRFVPLEAAPMEPFSFRFKKANQPEFADEEEAAAQIERAKKCIKTLAEWGRDHAAQIQLVLEGHHPKSEKIATRRAEHIFDQLAPLVEKSTNNKTRIHLRGPARAKNSDQAPPVPVNIVGSRPRHSDPLDDDDDDDWHRVVLRLGSPSYPGEHGYRYFPGYYRHLFDTMRRTPIYDREGREEPETAYDNLVATSRTAFADPDHRLMVLTRRRLRSLEELREELETLLGSLHFTWRDIVRFQLKVLRYMTSCAKRRKTYESMSWWSFIEGDKFSEAAREHMLGTPHALVAMSAKHSDARVQGNTLVQLLLAHLRHGERADLSLNGPTSEAWLDHWRRFLEFQGVKFYKGELEFFAENNLEVIPIARDRNGKVDTCKPHGSDPARKLLYDEPPLSPAERAALSLIKPAAPWTKHYHLGDEYVWIPESDATTTRPKLFIWPKMMERLRELDLVKRNDSQIKLVARPNRLDDSVCFGDRRSFIVLATDVASAKRAVRHLAAPKDSAVGMLQRYYLNRSDQPPKIEDPLRFFAGVQFYFDRRLDFFEGHIFYKQSPWGLTSISQTQFWRRRRVKKRDKYLTVLSVIIGRFDLEGLNGKIAWDCTREELAAEVWEQVSTSLSRTVSSLPKPDAYHVDDNLIFNRSDRFSFRAVHGDARSEVAYVTLEQGASDPRAVRAIDDAGWPSEHAFLWAKPNEWLDTQIVSEVMLVPPRNGIVTVHEGVTGTVHYRPNAGFTGLDCFVLEQNRERKVVSVEVRAKAAPVAHDHHHQPVTDPVDLAKLRQWPPEPDFGLEFAFEIVCQPTRGTLWGTQDDRATSKLEYKPDTNSGPCGDRIGRNLSPFHTNPVDDYCKRPGWLPDTKARRNVHHQSWPPTKDFRHNVYKNLVLAGTYMKTFTRLTTMEAANESARHAVNTILAELSVLDNGQQVAEPCAIWNPEDNELDELAPLRHLDEALVDAGLPHFADILELDRLPDLIHERHHDDLSMQPNFEQLGRLLHNDPKLGTKLGELLREFGGDAWTKLGNDPLALLTKLGKRNFGPDALTKAAKLLLGWLDGLGDDGDRSPK